MSNPDKQEKLPPGVEILEGGIKRYTVRDGAHEIFYLGEDAHSFVARKSKEEMKWEDALLRAQLDLDKQTNVAEKDGIGRGYHRRSKAGHF